MEVTVRSEFGPAAPTLRERRSLPAGQTTLTVAAERLRPQGGFAGGRQIVDVILRDAKSGATLDWATATFEVAKRATVTGVKPNAGVYRVGDTLSVVTRAAGRLEGLQMRLELRDDLGRLLSREDKPTPGEKTFFPRLEGFVGKRGFLTASLVEGDRIVDQLRAEPVVVVQRERRSKEYRALLSFESPRPSLASLPAATAALARHGQRVHVGREGQRRPGSAAGVVRRLLVRPGTHDTRGPGGGDPRVRAHGRFRLAPVPDQERALQAHGRLEVPGAEPQPRRSRSPPHPGRRLRLGRPQQGRLQHGLLLRGRRRLPHLLRRPRGLLLRAVHPGELPPMAEGAVRVARGLESHLAKHLRQLGRGQAKDHRGSQEGGSIPVLGRSPHLHGSVVRERVPGRA